jgi:hypothetical protein
MLSGKAISRALRGYNLVDGALGMLLIEVLLCDEGGCQDSDIGEKLCESDEVELQTLFAAVMENNMSIESASSLLVLCKLSLLVESLKTRVTRLS